VTRRVRVFSVIRLESMRTLTNCSEQKEENLLPMNDEMLIECVRQHVELYDISDKRYIDGAHKQRVWKKISQQLGHSGKLSTLLVPSLTLDASSSPRYGSGISFGFSITSYASLNSGR